MDVVIVRADKTWARLKNPEGYGGDFMYSTEEERHFVRQEVRHVYPDAGVCKAYRCADCIKIYREWQIADPAIRELLLRRIQALVRVFDGRELCPVCQEGFDHATADLRGVRTGAPIIDVSFSHNSTRQSACNEVIQLNREQVFGAMKIAFNPEEGRFPFIRGADETVASP